MVVRLVCADLCYCSLLTAHCSMQSHLSQKQSKSQLLRTLCLWEITKRSLFCCCRRHRRFHNNHHSNAIFIDKTFASSAAVNSDSYDLVSSLMHKDNLRARRCNGMSWSRIEIGKKMSVTETAQTRI